MSDEETQRRLEEVLREAEPRRPEAARPSPGDAAPDAAPEGDPPPAPGETRSEAESAAEASPGAQQDPGEVLGDALDRLEASVTLLLDRQRELAERVGGAEARKRDAERKLARLAGEGIDPGAIERRIGELEEENERLSRHAAHLEERIRGLMSRVRYATGT